MIVRQVVKRNPSQKYSKCHPNQEENFPKYCDWPVGELATFELAVALDLSPVLSLVLAGTLDNAKVEKVLAHHRAACGAEWKRDEV